MKWPSAVGMEGWADFSTCVIWILCCVYFLFIGIWQMMRTVFTGGHLHGGVRENSCGIPAEERLWGILRTGKGKIWRLWNSRGTAQKWSRIGKERKIFLSFFCTPWEQGPALWGNQIGMMGLALRAEEVKIKKKIKKIREFWKWEKADFQTGAESNEFNKNLRNSGCCLLLFN